MIGIVGVGAATAIVRRAVRPRRIELKEGILRIV
jgi:hypothetical protein